MVKKPTAAQVDKEAYSQQINLFRQRSRNLRTQAWLALVLIMALLLAAVAIFFFASEIAKRDVSTDEETAISKQIESEVSALSSLEETIAQKGFNKNLSSLLLVIQDLRSQLITTVVNRVSFLDSTLASPSERSSRSNNSQRVVVFDVSKSFQLKEIQYPVLTQPVQQEINELPNVRIDFFDPTVRVGLISGDVLDALNADGKLVNDVNLIWSRATNTANDMSNLLDQANADYRAVLVRKEKIGQLNSSLTELKKKREEADGDVTTSMTLLIQTNITRFGPMLVIFFFVSILVNLYRYSIRLSAYYEARADALFMLSNSIESETFDSLVTALTPDNHDVGKAPKVPTDYVVDLAKTAVSKIT